MGMQMKWVETPRATKGTSEGSSHITHRSIRERNNTGMSVCLLK